MEEKDRIGEVFKGKSVFISGASGFIGKLLIEKLLRCTDVAKIYLLLREKKGKSPKERISDIFSNVCFTLLKEKNPEAIDKCILISGNVLEENLGISDTDRKILQENVNFIIHSAASTRFDDTMKYAVTMNTRGTKYMLDLAKECKNLELFVHVSTAYAYPHEKVIEEKYYDPPADPEAVLKSIGWINEDDDGVITKQLLGNCPNTYTFSKALAEALVKNESNNIPTIIVRPAIVIPCLDEPLPGYVNNLQGPIGIFVGAGKGIIRTMYMDSKSYANLIPADSVVNCIFISCWDFLNTGKQRVFNLCVPECDVRMTWEEIIELGRDVIYNEVPYNQMLWYPGGNMTKSKLWSTINFVLFQILPAIIVDFLFTILGYKRILLDINIRIYKSQEMFEYYANRIWKFDVSYLIDLRRKMNQIEKKKYKADADNLDLKKYLINCMMYTRRHIFKETDDMLPRAKKLMTILFVLDRVVKILFFVVIIKYFYEFCIQPIFT